MATPVADFCGVLAESKRIMKAHSRHFLALSVLFLLPLSFTFISFPTLQLSFTDSDSSPAKTLIRSTTFLHHHRVALKSLLFAFLALSFSLCAAASITYSVYHGFYGRPVKFVSAIKSLYHTLLRLFVTVFCAKIIVCGIIIVFAVVGFLLIRGIEFLGFHVSYSSTYFMIGYWIWLIGLGLVLLYMQVSWSLVCAVVVAESSWGFEPLRRSAYWVRGVRGVALCLLLFFGGILWLMVWGSWHYGLGSGVMRAVLFVFATVGGSAFMMVVLLYSVAANTVLYMYCKALHGELAMEIAEEFAREYVSLPFDDEKIPHVVSVIQP